MAVHLRTLFVDDWAWGMSSKGEHLICLMYEVQHKILNHNGPFDHCIASKGKVPTWLPLTDTDLSLIVPSFFDSTISLNYNLSPAKMFHYQLHLLAEIKQSKHIITFLTLRNKSFMRPNLFPFHSRHDLVTSCDTTNNNKTVTAVWMIHNTYNQIPTLCRL